MMKYIFLGWLLIFIFSCELKDQPIEHEVLLNDTILVTMDSILENPIFEFNSFSTSPYPEATCRCNFSITKSVFQNQQYVFSSSLDEGTPSYMQFNGKWVEFKLDTFTQKQDSIILNVINDSLQVSIIAAKDSVIQDLNHYQGELQISREGNRDEFKANIYGSCEIP